MILITKSLFFSINTVFNFLSYEGLVVSVSHYLLFGYHIISAKFNVIRRYHGSFINIDMENSLIGAD